MDVVIAIDSFKGSLSSIEAGNAAKEGILRVYSDARVSVRPIADGGEGTADTLTEGANGEKINITVKGPLGEPVNCSYGILNDGITAVMEMAAAAGLVLVPESKRDPMNTTTFGVGQMILDAVSKGCRRFIIGIGGSSTNDGGAGMLQALGFKLLNAKKQQIPFGAKGLQQIIEIDDSDVEPVIKECEFNIACDVKNILCGKSGCSCVYGPQKGASPDNVRKMDNWLNHFADICHNKYPASDPEIPGTGAAGGLGFAFLTFFNASLTSGVDLILKETHLEDHIKKADIVVTGEGRLDEQTSMGKTPSGVAKLAKKHNKVVLAFSGCVSHGARECNKTGIDAFFPILRNPITLEQAMDKNIAASNMSDTVEQAFRLIKAVIH